MSCHPAQPARRPSFSLTQRYELGRRRLRVKFGGLGGRGSLCARFMLQCPLPPALRSAPSRRTRGLRPARASWALEAKRWGRRAPREVSDSFPPGRLKRLLQKQLACVLRDSRNNDSLPNESLAHGRAHMSSRHADNTIDSSCNAACYSIIIRTGWLRTRLSVRRLLGGVRVDLNPAGA